MTYELAEDRYIIEPWRAAIFRATGFELHPGQARLLNSFLNYDFTWSCGGRRGGKSEVVARIVFSEFVRYKDTIPSTERWPKKILILAPEYKQARIIFGKVHRLVKKFGVPLVTDRFSAGEMELESAWGSLIMCMTGRNKDAWPGFDWDLVVVDEAPIFKDGAAFEELLFPTLLDAKGKFLAIGTPDYPGSFSHRWMLDGLDPDNEQWGFAHWTTTDNWYIPHAAEWIERQRKSIPDDIIQRQYMARYVSRSGLVYNEYLECIGEFDTSEIEHGRWHRAGDFGFVNPFACAVVCQIGEMTYIVDEYYETQRNNSEHAPHLRALDHKYPFHNRKTFNVWDPENPEGIDFLSKWRDSQGGRIKGHWVKDYSKGGIIDRIDMIRRRMISGHIRIHPRCKNFIRELSLYAYPDKKPDKAASEKPMDKDNHLIKAVEYLTEHLYGDTFIPLDPEQLKARSSKRKSEKILRGYKS